MGEAARQANPFAGRIAVDPESGCWNWLGCIQANGYGRIRLDGRVQYCHRASYEYFHGEIPEGFDVCHRCDNRRCCNPDHLFSGTRLDNMNDASSKGRIARGARLSVMRQGRKSSFAKLDDSEVLAIRDEHRQGARTDDLATRFGVSPDNIRRIVRRDTWRHI